MLYTWYLFFIIIGMLISELSKRTGIAIHTLRYYENYGFFKGEKDQRVKTNHYKQYDEVLVEKIQLIKEAKDIGFTLAEIKGLLDDWFNDQISKERKVDILQEKIQEIDLKILQLKQMRNLIIEGIESARRGDC